MLRLEAASEDNRLNAEHEGDSDDHKHQEEVGDSLLAVEEVDVLDTSLKEVVDHDGNDRRSRSEVSYGFRVGGVGVHGVEPFTQDEEVHPPEESIQDDEPSNNFKPEHDVLALEAGVEALDDDAHAHVEHTNDHRGPHLDAVDKGEVLG